MKPNEHGVITCPQQVILQGKAWRMVLCVANYRNWWFAGADGRYGNCQVGAGGFGWPVSTRRGKKFRERSEALAAIRQSVIDHLQRYITNNGLVEKTVVRAIKQALEGLQNLQIHRQASLPGMDE